MLDALSRAKGASYPPLHELCPAVSRQLSDVIDKALAFDYHDRYRRMLDFLDALEQVVRPEDYDIDLGALMPEIKGIEAGGNSCRDFRRLGEDVSG